MVILFNVLMMSGVMARVIPSSALVSAVPAMADRGAFMSINASLQQIAGGIAAAFAGIIVVQTDKTSPLQHYNTLGYIIVAISMLSMYMLFRVSAMEKDAIKEQKL
jgi:predicted MFS family arabinose efflux permease